MIPMLGLGTYRLEGQQCVDFVVHAIKSGYRMIDTAMLYANHREIGRALKYVEQCMGISRRDIFISSKIHDKVQKTGQIQDSVKEILRELDIEYLDQLLLHSPIKNKFVKAWKCMEEVQMQGLVRCIGVSNFKISDLNLLMKHCVVRPSINQIELSPFCTRKNLVQCTRDHGIAIQAWGSLTAGKRLNDVNLRHIVDQYNDSMHMQVESSDLLLKWAQQSGYSVVPKPDSICHIDMNQSCQSIPVIPDELMVRLDALNENYFTIKKHGDYNLEDL
jgi:diketogulonate reductase-like aldo/keto reductase